VVPRYNKSAHDGKGDRFPESEWKTLKTPPNIIFVEGWMLGFQPNLEAENRDPYFAPINEALPKYMDWYAFFDAFIYLRAQDHRFVLDWRVEAEEKMKARGLPGMSREEVEAYAAAFMVAYEAFSHTVSKETLGVEQYFEVVIGRDRLPIAS
jgi:D-glycerate 3-kinase